MALTIPEHNSMSDDHPISTKLRDRSDECHRWPAPKPSIGEYRC